MGHVGQAALATVVRQWLQQHRQQAWAAPPGYRVAAGHGDPEARGTRVQRGPRLQGLQVVQMVTRGVLLRPLPAA